MHSSGVDVDAELETGAADLVLEREANEDGIRAVDLVRPRERANLDGAARFEDGIPRNEGLRVFEIASEYLLRRANVVR